MSESSYYKYDLAISFLGQDEPLAQQIADLLQERFEVFIYSKQQESLAGIDGEEGFSRVFGQEARTVCVLYRAGWGESPWTRIEQTAIRNRAYSSGYDFCFFVQLEPGATFPPWIPKTQLWYDLERWGLEGAATVLEARIQQSGGGPRIETVLDKARRLQRKAELEEERRGFLNSQEGVIAATDEIRSLFETVESLVKSINDEHKASFNLSFEQRSNYNYISISAWGSTVAVAWSEQWANSLKQSALCVKLLKAPAFLGETTEVQEWRYHFDRLRSGKLGWRDSEDRKQFFSSSDLANRFVGTMLDLKT